MTIAKGTNGGSYLFPDEWMFYENLLFLFIFEEKIKVLAFTNLSVFAHFELFWTYYLRLQKYHDQDWWDSKSAAWTPETVKYPLVEPPVCWHGNEPVQAHIQCLLNEFVNETAVTQVSVFATFSEGTAQTRNQLLGRWSDLSWNVL